MTEIHVLENKTSTLSKKKMFWSKLDFMQTEMCQNSISFAMQLNDVFSLFSHLLSWHVNLAQHVKVSSCKVLVDVCRLTVKLSRHEFIAALWFLDLTVVARFVPAGTSPVPMNSDSDLSHPLNGSLRREICHTRLVHYSDRATADEEIHQTKSLSEP